MPRFGRISVVFAANLPAILVLGPTSHAAKDWGSSGTLSLRPDPTQSGYRKGTGPQRVHDGWRNHLHFFVKHVVPRVVEGADGQAQIAKVDHGSGFGHNLEIALQSRPSDLRYRWEPCPLNLFSAAGGRGKFRHGGLIAVDGHETGRNARVYRMGVGWLDTGQEGVHLFSARDQGGRRWWHRAFVGSYAGYQFCVMSQGGANLRLAPSEPGPGLDATTGQRFARLELDQDLAQTAVRLITKRARSSVNGFRLSGMPSAERLLRQLHHMSLLYRPRQQGATHTPSKQSGQSSPNLGATR